MGIEADSTNDTSAACSDHELVTAFGDRGLALNATLVDMLNEHFSHCTERRGCGFTQATRHLADLVNQPPSHHREAATKLFARGMTMSPADVESAVVHVVDALALAREESLLLARLIADIVHRTAVGPPELVPWCDEIKVGTCPMAEKYFLEIADRFVRRTGRANILVSATGEPLLIEKLNLGDTHSCISVTELVLCGVRLPAGCLFGVRYQGDDDSVPGLRPNRHLPGDVVAVSRVAGFRFLRFTTLAVSPANRARAFSSHFQAQLDAPLYRPAQATIQQLHAVALLQL